MKVAIGNTSADTDIEEVYIRFANNDEKRLFAEHLLSSMADNNMYYVGPKGFDPKAVKKRMEDLL